MYRSRLNAFYFGKEHINKEVFMIWYNEIIKKMQDDGFEATHLGILLSKSYSSNLRIKKRVEKKYMNIVDTKFADVEGFSVISAMPEDGFKAPAILYNIDLGLSLAGLPCKNTLKHCAHIAIDMSIVKKVNIEGYAEIIKKYIPWEEEHIFETSNGYVNVNYILDHYRKECIQQAISNGDVRVLKITKRD